MYMYVYVYIHIYIYDVTHRDMYKNIKRTPPADHQVVQVVGAWPAHVPAIASLVPGLSHGTIVWVSINGEYPQSSSIYRWDFPQQKPSSYWGTPSFGNHHIYIYICKYTCIRIWDIPMIHELEYYDLARELSHILGCRTVSLK